MKLIGLAARCLVGFASGTTCLLAETATAQRPVLVYADGKRLEAQVTGRNVREALAAVKVEFNADDLVHPTPETALGPRTKIWVKRVEFRERSLSKPVPFKVELRHEATLRGRTRIEQVGETGQEEQLVREKLVDGKVTDFIVLASKVTREPRAQIVAVGRSEILASRGLTSRKVLRMEATGYSSDPRECPRSSKGRTASGLMAGYGLVAVDPRVIKLGTRLYIEGYGYALAADKGSAIKGLKIDLGHNSHGEALAVGRRSVRVHVLQ